MQPPGSGPRGRCVVCSTIPHRYMNHCHTPSKISMNDQGSLDLSHREGPRASRNITKIQNPKKSTRPANNLRISQASSAFRCAALRSPSGFHISKFAHQKCSTKTFPSSHLQQVHRPAARMIQPHHHQMCHPCPLAARHPCRSLPCNFHLLLVVSGTIDSIPAQT